MFRLEHYAIDPEVKMLREENARLKYQLAHPVVAVQELKVPMEMVFRIGIDKAVTKAIKLEAYRELAEKLKRVSTAGFVSNVEIDVTVKRLKDEVDAV